ncbi:MAG TPA: hypothetical protein VH835_16615 [Dongiaceae bacterium]|jgi:hypothetical protein
MKPRRLQIVLAAALILAPMAQDAAACARPEDLPPLRTRAFQTELMVSALSCGETKNYNKFVTDFRPELVKQGKAMQAFFKREHGSRAGAETDKFVTQLANLASQRSSRNKPAFCSATKKLFGDVFALKQPGELKTLVAGQPAPVLPGVKSCGIEPASSTTTP